MYRKLHRNKRDGRLGGVCAGLGDYFDIDPVIIRLLFLLALFLGGGLIVYLIAWVVIPVKKY